MRPFEGSVDMDLYKDVDEDDYLRKEASCSKTNLLPAIALYLTQQNWKFYIFVIGNVQNFFGVVGSLGENLDFLDPGNFTFKEIRITKPSKPSSAQSKH